MVYLSPPWPGASGEPKEIAGGSPYAMQVEKQVQSWPALRLTFPADPGSPISYPSPLSWGHSGRPYPVHPCTQPREGEPWRAALCAGQCAMHPGLAEVGGAPLWGSKLPEGI